MGARCSCGQLFCILFVPGKLFKFLIFCKHSFKYRLTCTRNDQIIQILNILWTLFQIMAYLYKEWCFFSFRVKFFSKLNVHPHDTWVGIIERTNLNIFQYKLLIIPSNQYNHKSLFVITGLQIWLHIVTGLSPQTILAFFISSPASARYNQV